MRAKINIPEMREMIMAGKSAQDIGNRFDVTFSAISKSCRAHKLPLPVRQYRQKPVGDGPRLIQEPRKVDNTKPKPDAPKPVTLPSDLHPRTVTLIATGGRYADLAAWAKEWGVSEGKALQEWHKLRLTVRKGGAI